MIKPKIKKKKIIHICSSLNGGAGIASHRIHKALESHGYISTMYVKHYNKQLNEKNILFEENLYFNNFKNLIKTIFPIFLINKLKKIFFKNNIDPHCFYQKNEMNFNGINKNFSNIIKNYNIFFIHWISDFINIHDIEKILRIKNVKIIFVMLDQAHITGGCHFSLSCKKFQVNCYNCPALEKGNQLAHYQFKQKIKTIKKINASLITFSLSDFKLAKTSKIRYLNYINTKIPIDTEVFFPYIYDLKKKNKVKYLLSCAYDLENLRKGADHFIKVLDYLDKNLLTEKIKVLCTQVPNYLKKRYKNIEFELFVFSNKFEELSIIYKKTDILVFSSIADSAPQMLSEALICGTQVVSFDIANVKELITNKNDGFIIKNFNTEKMAEKIHELLYSKALTLESNKTKRSKKAINIHSTKNFIKKINFLIK